MRGKKGSEARGYWEMLTHGGAFVGRRLGFACLSFGDSSMKAYEEGYVRIVTTVAWNTGRGILFLINAKAHNLDIAFIFYFKACSSNLEWWQPSQPLLEDSRKPVSRWPDAYWLLASSWQTKDGNPVTFPSHVLLLCGQFELHVIYSLTVTVTW